MDAFRVEVETIPDHREWRRVSVLTGEPEPELIQRQIVKADETEYLFVSEAIKRHLTRIAD